MTTEVTNIWNNFHKELGGFIFTKTRNQADTDDILQEVFIKIIRHIEKVEQAGNVRQYLYAIVKNSINDYFRRMRFVESVDDIPEMLSEQEEESLNTTIADCCVKPFINKLPEKYKKALIMAEFEDVSQKDLAEKLDISYSGAKSRVQRGREKLKGLILDCCPYKSDAYGNLRGGEKKNCSC